MGYQQRPGYGAPAAPRPGWYPDPYGPPALRWWDGTQWGTQTQPLPQSEQVPHAAPPGSASATPSAYDTFPGQDAGQAGRHRASGGSPHGDGYTQDLSQGPLPAQPPSGKAAQSPPWPWVVAAAPLVQLGIAILAAVLTSPADNVTACLLCGAAVAALFAIFAAFRDVRALRAAGETLNPALPWWCLLVPWAYLWARAVKRPGRTNTDWGLLAGSVAAWLLVIVISSPVLGAVTTDSATFSQAGVQAQIASGIKAQTGVTVTVSCPANPPLDPGSKFECIARAADGSSTVVTVTIQDRQGDVIWQTGG